MIFFSPVYHSLNHSLTHFYLLYHVQCHCYPLTTFFCIYLLSCGRLDVPTPLNPLTHSLTHTHSHTHSHTHTPMLRGIFSKKSSKDITINEPHPHSLTHPATRVSEGVDEDEENFSESSQNSRIKERKSFSKKFFGAGERKEQRRSASESSVPSDLVSE
jgi:hypothetical protein